jgi:hypothetical protein
MDDITKCFHCAENINPADPGNSLGAKLRGPEGDFDVEFHTRCWYDFGKIQARELQDTRC